MIPVKLDMSGMDRFKKKTEELSGTHNYSLSELLPDKFIEEHTKYSTLQALADAGGITEPADINSEAFSQFVADNSKFSSYTEMLQAGYAEFVKTKVAVMTTEQIRHFLITNLIQSAPVRLKAASAIRQRETKVMDYAKCETSRPNMRTLYIRTLTCDLDLAGFWQTTLAT